MRHKIGGRNKERTTHVTEETVDFIAHFYLDNGIPPTIRQMADGFGIAINGVSQRLKRLMKHGFLRRVNVEGQTHCKYLPVYRKGSCPCCGQALRANRRPARGASVPDIVEH